MRFLQNLDQFWTKMPLKYIFWVCRRWQFWTFYVVSKRFFFHSLMIFLKILEIIVAPRVILSSDPKRYLWSVRVAGDRVPNIRFRPWGSVLLDPAVHGMEAPQGTPHHSLVVIETQPVQGIFDQNRCLWLRFFEHRLRQDRSPSPEVSPRKSTLQIRFVNTSSMPEPWWWHIAPSSSPNSITIINQSINPRTGWNPTSWCRPFFENAPVGR